MLFPSNGSNKIRLGSMARIVLISTVATVRYGRRDQKRNRTNTSVMPQKDHNTTNTTLVPMLILLLYFSLSLSLSLSFYYVKTGKNYLYKNSSPDQPECLHSHSIRTFQGRHSIERFKDPAQFSS